MKENVLNGKVLWTAQGGKTVQESKPAGRGQAAQRALRTAGAIVGAVLLIGVMVGPVCAQSYPNKTIRLIVPYVPGGTSDTLGRIIGAKLAEQLGQPVVIENRTGAGGNIGADFVAKAQPDGYTILIANADMSASPAVYKKLTYDPVQDLAPISLVAQVPLLMCVRRDLPVNNLKELLEYAKANPGKLNYGSSGVGSLSHLPMEFLKRLAKVNIVHVPYKGAGQSTVGLATGEVDIIMTAAPSHLPNLQAGKIKAIAVGSRERWRVLPNVPTAKEAGLDKFEFRYWMGLFAPAKTPRDIINRLRAEWIKIAAMPDVKEKIENIGFDVLSGQSPEQFSELLKADIAFYTKIVEDANIPKSD